MPVLVAGKVEDNKDYAEAVDQEENQQQRL